MTATDTIAWAFHEDLRENENTIVRMLEPALDLFRRVLDYDAAGIWLALQEDSLIPVVYGEKELDEPFFSRPPQPDLAAAILEYGHSVCWHSNELTRYHPRSLSCLGRRLHLGSGDTGVLVLHRLEGELFDEEDLVLVEDLVRLTVTILGAIHWKEREMRRPRVPAAPERVDAVLQAVPIGIAVLNPDLTVAAANPAFRQLLALDPGILQGQDLFRLLPELGQPEYASRIRRAAHGDPVSLESYALNRPHGTGYFDIQFSPFGPKTGAAGQVVMTLTDVSNQVETRNALRLNDVSRAVGESQGQLAAVLNSIGDGLIAYTPDGRLILANPQIFRTYGLDRNSVALGKTTVDDLLARLHDRLVQPETIRRLDFELGRSQQPFVEQYVEMFNPQCFVRRRLSAIRDAQERVLGYVEVHQDLTEIRRSERLRDELLMLMSHELRTPLMSILGYAQLLQQRPQATEARRIHWLDMIVLKSRALNHLIDQLLDLSRLKANRFVLHLARTDLAELVQRVVNEVAAANPEHRFETQLAEVGKLRVDSERLAEALRQVLSNAARFSLADSLISVRILRQANEALIAVSDQGMGIEPEYVERIFEPFFHVPRPEIQELAGSGLGLSLSRGLLRAHQGRIWCVSQPGQGSTFYLALPLAESGPRAEQ